MAGYLIGGFFFLYTIISILTSDKAEKKKRTKAAKKARASKLKLERQRHKIQKLKTKEAAYKKAAAEKNWMAHQKNLLKLKKSSAKRASFSEALGALIYELRKAFKQEI